VDCRTQERFFFVLVVYKRYLVLIPENLNQQVERKKETNFIFYL
jgi:hypothetical protein